MHNKLGSRLNAINTSKNNYYDISTRGKIKKMWRPTAPSLLPLQLNKCPNMFTVPKYKEGNQTVLSPLNQISIGYVLKFKNFK